MEDEYRQIVGEFYSIYRPLQRRHNLRLHSHFSIYPNSDDFIEIWEYEGGQRKKCVCKVREETDIECYKRAIEALQSYGKEREGTTYAKRAG